MEAGRDAGISAYCEVWIGCLFVVFVVFSAAPNSRAYEVLYINPKADDES